MAQARHANNERAVFINVLALTCDMLLSRARGVGLSSPVGGLDGVDGSTIELDMILSVPPPRDDRRKSTHMSSLAT